MQKTISWLASSCMLAAAFGGAVTAKKIDFKRDIAPETTSSAASSATIRAPPLAIDSKAALN